MKKIIVIATALIAVMSCNSAVNANGQTNEQEFNFAEYQKKYVEPLEKMQKLEEYDKFLFACDLYEYTMLSSIHSKLVNSFLVGRVEHFKGLTISDYDNRGTMLATEIIDKDFNRAVEKLYDFKESLEEDYKDILSSDYYSMLLKEWEEAAAVLSRLQMEWNNTDAVKWYRKWGTNSSLY